MDKMFVLELTALLIGVHSVYSSLELLSVRGIYQPGGIQDWNVIRTTFDGGVKIRLLDTFLKNFQYILLARLIFGVFSIIYALLLEGATVILTVIILVLFLSDIAILLRHHGGLGGPSHMSLIVNFGLLIAISTPEDNVLTLAGILFIAIQGTLGYFIAGLEKLKGGKWRNGSAVINVLSTHTWGHPKAYAELKKYPELLSIGTRGVVLFEILFPIIIFSDEMISFIILGMAILMHISISILMGINGFLTSFSSTYPSIMYFGYITPSII